MRYALRSTLLTLVSLTTIPGWALDVGDPSFRGFDGENRWQYEWIGDWSRRDVHSQYDNALVGTPSTGPVGFFPAVPGQNTRTKIDHWKVRVTHYPNELFACHFHFGVDGETNTGDDLIVVGGAIRGLLAESGPFQLAAQMQADFIPEVTERSSGSFVSAGRFEERSEYDAYEFGVSLLGSMRATYFNDAEWVTYAGPQVSAYRAEWGAVTDLIDTGDRFWLSGVSKQESYFGIVVGTRLDFSETWSARIEGRFLDEESLSIGVAASY